MLTLLYLIIIINKIEFNYVKFQHYFGRKNLISEKMMSKKLFTETWLSQPVSLKKLHSNDGRR